MKTPKPIEDQIRSMGYYLQDMRNDGFSQFEVKKKLYKILWETEKQLKMSSSFVGETDWLMQNEKKHIS